MGRAPRAAAVVVIGLSLAAVGLAGARGCGILGLSDTIAPDADIMVHLPASTRATESCAGGADAGATSAAALMSNGAFLGNEVRVRGRVTSSLYASTPSRVAGYSTPPALYLRDDAGGTVELGGSKDFGGVDDPSRCTVVTGTFRSYGRGAALFVEPTAAELARDAAAERTDVATIVARPGRWVGRAVRLKGSFQAVRDQKHVPNCMVVQASSGEVSGTCAVPVGFVDTSSKGIIVVGASCNGTPNLTFPPGCDLGDGEQEVIADVVPSVSTDGVGRVPGLVLRTTRKLVP